VKRFLSILVLSLSLVACGSDDNSNKKGGADSGTGAAIGRHTTVTVGEKGTTLQLGEMKLAVPEGALAKDVAITIKVVAPPVPIPDGYVQASDVYECTPPRSRVQ
jgi:hypothetical protein